MSKQPSPRAELGALVIRLARQWRREADQVLAERGLSEATALPLLSLRRCGDGIRQGMLAEEMGMEGPSLVRLLDLLAGEGLLERRDDPSDRRAKTLHLTKAGETRVRSIEAVLDQLRGELQADIPAADLVTAFRTLTRIEQRIADRRDERSQAGKPATE